MSPVTRGPFVPGHPWTKLYARVDGLRQRALGEKDLAHVARWTIIAFVVKGLAAALTFAFNFLVARRLGASATGVFILGITLVTMITVLAKLGMDSVVVRYVAVHAATRDWAGVRGVYRWGVGLPFFASIATGLVCYFLAPFMASELFGKPDLTLVLRLLSVSIPASVVVALNGEAIKGLGSVFWSQSTQSVVAPLITVGAILATGELTVTRASWLYDAGTAIAAAIGIVVWMGHVRHTERSRAKYSPAPLLRMGRPLLFVSVMIQVMAWAAVLLLGAWKPSDEVAIFGIASRVALATSVLLRSVSTVVAPRFAAAFHSGDHALPDRTARHSTLMITVAASPVFLLLVFAPGMIMGLFGAEFAKGGLTLAILAVGQFVNVSTGTVGDLLAMTGHEKFLRNALGIGAAANVLLCALLIPTYGAVGAAVATSASVIGLNVSQAVFVYRRLGIWIVPFLRPPARSPESEAP